MKKIRPVSDLRNKYPEIEELTQSQAVFLTRNGVGTSVLMSMEEYDRLRARLEVYEKLAEAETKIAEGDEGKDFESFFGEMREKFV